MESHLHSLLSFLPPNFLFQVLTTVKLTKVFPFFHFTPFNFTFVPQIHEAISLVSNRPGAEFLTEERELSAYAAEVGH